MPFLLPLATLITGVLTVKTVNKTIKTYERRKKRDDAYENSFSEETRGQRAFHEKVYGHPDRMR